MLEIWTVNKGAELVSVKFNGEEKLHDAENFWFRHSPVLFPIVGKLKNDKTIIDGKEYKMTQHGFARDMDFKNIEKNSYMLEANEETLKMYPYRFQIYIWYEIADNKLKVNYKVKNIDNREIFFAIGAHPAFKCDYTSGKYSIKFNKKEENIEILELENGLISNKKVNPIKIIENKIKLNSDSFKKDAIIMKNINSNKIFLECEDEKILSFEFGEFPYVALWSKENANFICIEPWFNVADSINSKGTYLEKENLIKLSMNEEFKCNYEIEFF